MNKFFVALAPGQQIAILKCAPVCGPLTPDDALLLAAWLVTVAEPFATKPFDEFLQEAQS